MHKYELNAYKVVRSYTELPDLVINVFSITGDNDWVLTLAKKLAVDYPELRISVTEREIKHKNIYFRRSCFDTKFVTP